MQNLMQRWMKLFEQMLEERSGTALTVTPEVTESRPASLFVGTLTLDGPLRGMLRIAVPEPEMVQFVQLVGRQPLDAAVPLDEKVLSEWRGLLEESATRLAAQLLADGDGEYTAILRELRADDAAGMPDSESASAPDSASEAAAGREESAYVLRSGEIALRISIQTRMEAQAPEMAAAVVEAAAAMEAAPATEATVPMETPASEVAPTPIEAAAPEVVQAPEPLAPPSTANVAAPTEDAAGEAARKAAAKAAEYAAQQMAIARAAEEEMDRAATAAEARSARRHVESSTEESSAFRTHPERLDLLLDIELEATLRFGAVELPLRKVLELGPGDVLQLDRHVQEPVDLVVGDRIVARGEVVLVGGNFGLHVTEVAEPRRRLETIRCLF